MTELLSLGLFVAVVLAVLAFVWCSLYVVSMLWRDWRWSVAAKRDSRKGEGDEPPAI